MSDLPKIEKGVPVPPHRNRTGMADLLRSMSVGDSIFIPVHDERDVLRTRNRTYSSCTKLAPRRIHRSHS